MRDTIFAPATAAGVAAITVLRVSGAAAGAAFSALSDGAKMPEARRATRVRLVDPVGGAPIDDALVLWFPAPRSFTGEDVLELHLHGGRAVLAAAIGALQRVPGLRLARAGEFTRRAFDSGKLDLARVEALADLIAADTTAQARQALRQLDGALGDACEAWRQRLLRALAHAEAEIDFPDEDLPGGLIAALAPELRTLAEAIARVLDDARRGERLREGYSIAIAGPPNAGKSSLLNALAGRDAAIVSSLAGTTRDVLEVALDFDGMPVILADTAGLRDEAALPDDAHRAIELEGIRRARLRAERADLVLIIVDAARAADELATAAIASLRKRESLIVVNKIDAAPMPHDIQAIGVSAHTGLGLDTLIEVLRERARDAMGSGEAALVTRARHREALTLTRQALERALTAEASELIAEELRGALAALGRITGRTGIEDMLTALFAEFCVGK
jgi:tRNA modification GTPase